jgi:hypothetical protein
MANGETEAKRHPGTANKSIVPRTGPETTPSDPIGSSSTDCNSGTRMVSRAETANRCESIT